MTLSTTLGPPEADKVQKADRRISVSTFARRPYLVPAGQGETMVRVGIASDHGGFTLKGQMAESLRGSDYEVIDFGAHQLNPEGRRLAQSQAPGSAQLKQLALVVSPLRVHKPTDELVSRRDK